MGQIADNCNLDVDASELARALHRVVRAMHDGHCPKCGHLGAASEFVANTWYYGCYVPNGHCCPVCGFNTTAAEEEAALAAFRPKLNESVKLFEEWRKTL